VTERNALSQDTSKPGSLEQAVLSEIWSNGPQSADQIRRRVVPSRQLSDSTIRTVLRRLEAKGLIKRELRDKRYVYRGLKDRRVVAIEAVRALVDKFYSGSVASLLIGMVEEKIIEPKELRRLSRQLDDAQKRRTRP
jgi:predicted transcriptional regulator